MCLKKQIKRGKRRKTESNTQKPNGFIKNPNNPNGADSDSDSDSDNDSDNDRRRKKKNKYSDFVSLTEKRISKINRRTWREKHSVIH